MTDPSLTLPPEQPEMLSRLSQMSQPPSQNVLPTTLSPDVMSIEEISGHDHGQGSGINVEGSTSSSTPVLTGAHASGGEAEGDFVRNMMVQVWKKMKGIIPFVLLFCAKMLHDHSIGLLVLLGLTGTFWYADRTLKSCISQREINSGVVLKCLWILCLLTCSSIFLYYVFGDQQLYKCLYGGLPNLGSFDAWNLFWCVLITDYIFKYITICVKACVTLLPKYLLSYKKKGPSYLLIENLSQFYRLFPPTYSWFMFLTDNQQSGKDWYNAFLVVVYFISKVFIVYFSVKQLLDAWRRFCIDLSYGVKPSRDALSQIDNQCPICHDALDSPVQLHCKHIFCEECVTAWFNRERTCPMCRANIVDDPTWRDGATTYVWQIY